MALLRSGALRSTSRQLGAVQWRAFSTLHPLRISPTPHPSTAQIQPTSPADATQILINQRLHRPISPHLSIYKPQITWYASALNRITGSMLSGTFYIFGAAYLASPLFGWHLESASLAAAFASWPVWAKVATKMVAAWPFAFHGLNGIRHLVWDMGYWLTNKQIARSGWAVVGLSAVGAVVLAFV